MRQKSRKIGRMAHPLGRRGCGTVGRHVRARCHKLPRLLAVLVGFLLVLGAPATLPAQGPGVEGLQQKQAALAAESRVAVVQLYGLESRLAQARSDLARVQARADALGREQVSVRERVRAAKRTTTAAERRLGAQLRYLYEQGEPDPIAVVLGATSLEEAIDGLDAVHRAARTTQSVLDQARSARSRLATVQRELTRQVARTNQARVESRRDGGRARAGPLRAQFLSRRPATRAAADRGPDLEAGSSGPGGASARPGGDPRGIHGGDARPVGARRDVGPSRHRPPPPPRPSRLPPPSTPSPRLRPLRPPRPRRRRSPAER